MNGKGSKPRPYSVSQDEFAANWDNIFKKKSYTVEVKELENGDQYIELPDELLKSAGWKEGDEIEWKKVKQGYDLRKKA